MISYLHRLKNLGALTFSTAALAWYVINQKIRDSNRFMDMGVLHPNDKRRKEFIEKSLLEDKLPKQQPELPGITNGLCQLLADELSFIINNNPLDRETFQALSLFMQNVTARMAINDLTDSEISEYLTGQKPLCRLPLGDYEAGQYYEDLHVDVSGRIYLIPNSKSQ